jgi:hypothetical protein
MRYFDYIFSQISKMNLFLSNLYKKQKQISTKLFFKNIKINGIFNRFEPFLKRATDRQYANDLTVLPSVLPDHKNKKADVTPRSFPLPYECPSVF